MMLVMMASASVNIESIGIEPVPNRIVSGNGQSGEEKNNSMEDDCSTSV